MARIFSVEILIPVVMVIRNTTGLFMPSKNPAARIIEEHQRAAESSPADQQATSRPPAAKVSFGSVQASIWRNSSERGDYYTVTFDRRYQDKDDQWKSSNSYGPTDLLALQKVADMALDKVLELQQGRRRTA